MTGLTDQEFSLSQSFQLLSQEQYPEVTLWIKAARRASNKSMVRVTYWIKAWNPNVGTYEGNDNGRKVTKKGSSVFLEVSDLTEENVVKMNALYTGIATVLTQKVLENVTLEAQSIQD